MLHDDQATGAMIFRAPGASVPGCSLPVLVKIYLKISANGSKRIAPAFSCKCAISHPISHTDVGQLNTGATDSLPIREASFIDSMLSLLPQHEGSLPLWLLLVQTSIQRPNPSTDTQAGLFNIHRQHCSSLLDDPKYPRALHTSRPRDHSSPFENLWRIHARLSCHPSLCCLQHRKPSALPTCRLDIRYSVAPFHE